MTEEKKNLADIARKKRHLSLIEKLQSGKSLTKSEINELDEFENEKEKRAIVKAQDEIAKIMGVSCRTIQRWKKEGMPVTKEGYYDLDAIKKWYDEKSGLLSTEEGDEKPFWDKQLQKYKARILEIELKKMEGDIMTRSEVENGWAIRVAAVRAEFTALPDRVAPVLAMKEPREIKKLLLDAIIEITDEFAGVRK